MPLAYESRLVCGRFTERLGKQRNVRGFNAENRRGDLRELTIFEFGNDGEIGIRGFLFDRFCEMQDIRLGFQRRILQRYRLR